MQHSRRKLFVGLLGAGALVVSPAAMAVAAAPPAATAFVTAMIGPNGGSISGFGISARFAPGALTTMSQVILTDWASGLDSAPPSGQAVKTFGLQVCNGTTGCTSEFGNYANAPGGTEQIAGKTIPFTGGLQSGVNFGTITNKLVTISVRTGGDTVYIYNPVAAASGANPYPKLLPSTASAGVLTFQTFQPIVWVVTSPSK